MKISSISNSKVSTDIYSGFTFFTFLSRNKNNPICTTGTINSSCRSIFQYSDILNIGRIQWAQRILSYLEVTTSHSRLRKFTGRCLRYIINNVQRLIISAQWVSTANGNRIGSTRSRWRNTHTKTGDFTLQQVINRNSFWSFIFIRTHRSYGTGQITFTWCTVSHYNHLIQQLRIILHRHIDYRLVSHRNFLFCIANKRKDQYGFRVRNINLIVTINISDST